MKISDNVELIPGTMAHSYSIVENGKIFLVDSGTKGSGNKILNYYRAIGKEPDYILITHYHMDHIGGLNTLMDNFYSEVYVPSREVDIISGKSGYPEGTPAFLRLFTRVPAARHPERLKTAESLAASGVEAVNTEGHTPGSTSYFFPELGALCVGDALYNRRGSLAVNTMFSLDLKKASESREKILGMKPVLILPGHGDPIRI
ncbi:hypothetical protein IX51_10725 [uncultured archaeon]|nr:hypothetical protein IX51_10725 [uncultured archaeon]